MRNVLEQHNDTLINIQLDEKSNSYRLVSATNEMIVGRTTAIMLTLLQEGKSVHEVALYFQKLFPSAPVAELEDMIHNILLQLERTLDFNFTKAQKNKKFIGTLSSRIQRKWKDLKFLFTLGRKQLNKA